MRKCQLYVLGIILYYYSRKRVFFQFEISIKERRCKIRRVTAWPLILPLPNREQIIEIESAKSHIATDQRRNGL